MTFVQYRCLFMISIVSSIIVLVLSYLFCSHKIPSWQRFVDAKPKDEVWQSELLRDGKSYALRCFFHQCSQEKSDKIKVAKKTCKLFLWYNREKLIWKLKKLREKGEGEGLKKGSRVFLFSHIQSKFLTKMKTRKSWGCKKDNPKGLNMLFLHPVGLFEKKKKKKNFIVIMSYLNVLLPWGFRSRCNPQSDSQ